MASKGDVLTAQEALGLLKGERDYQIRKWGHRRRDDEHVEDVHSVAEFILCMEHHLILARAAATTEMSPIAALHELRKTVALGIACFEQNGCPVREPGPVKNVHDGLPT